MGQMEWRQLSGAISRQLLEWEFPVSGFRMTLKLVTKTQELTGPGRMKKGGRQSSLCRCPLRGLLQFGPCVLEPYLGLWRELLQETVCEQRQALSLVVLCPWMSWTFLAPAPLQLKLFISVAVS